MRLFLACATIALAAPMPATAKAPAAGTSIVAAVIKDKSDNCQPVMSGGVQYQSCNGIMYQRAQGRHQQLLHHMASR